MNGSINRLVSCVHHVFQFPDTLRPLFIICIYHPSRWYRRQISSRPRLTRSPVLAPYLSVYSDPINATILQQYTNPATMYCVFLEPGT